MTKKDKYSLLFAVLGALFYLPFLGGVHLFDWDEINFAEISREMIVTGDYLRVYIDFEPFYQKPPFFFWLQALSMHLFGIGDYAARFPNAICGILTLVILYRMGHFLRGHMFGLIWGLVYFGTLLPFLYFKSGIIDPYFNLFIFIGLYYIIRFHWRKMEKKNGATSKSAWLYLFLGGLFVGMGVLTKGPVAYLLVVLTMGVYWIYQRFRMYISIPEFLLFTLASALVSLIWFGLDALQNGPAFMIEFFRYQYELFSTPSAGHRGFPGYHFVVLLLGCFPASIFMLRSFKKFSFEMPVQEADFARWMKYLFWVVLILFTIVESKIVHYSSLCYFPLTYLAGDIIWRIHKGQIPFYRWMKLTLIGIGSLFILPMLLLPYLGNRIDLLKSYIDDPFTLGNLEADVHWSGFEVMPGLLLAVILFVSLRFLARKKIMAGIRVLFGGTALFVLIGLIGYIARIEGYSQRANVEFFEQVADEDCYTLTHRYKSFVEYWYARKRPATDPRHLDDDWLLNGDIDKPLYISARIHKAEELHTNPNP